MDVDQARCVPLHDSWLNDSPTRHGARLAPPGFQAFWLRQQQECLPMVQLWFARATMAILAKAPP